MEPPDPQICSRSKRGTPGQVMVSALSRMIFGPMTLCSFDRGELAGLVVYSQYQQSSDLIGPHGRFDSLLVSLDLAIRTRHQPYKEGKGSNGGQEDGLYIVITT